MQEVKSSILSVSTMKEEDSVRRVFFDFPYEKGKPVVYLLIVRKPRRQYRSLYKVQKRA